MKDSLERVHPQLDCLAVVGPTAVGKSSLAQLLALHYRTDVLSADSMQIYRGMDIGTAKVPVHERLVHHAGIDLVDPDEPYSAACYQSYARAHIDQHRAHGCLSVLCGGTGLYLRAALEDFTFAPGDQEHNESRERYLAYERTHGSQALYDLLVQRDLRSAQLIHPHNVRRVIRALELNDQNLAYADQSESFGDIRFYYRQMVVGLTCPRDLLYERINQRVDDMFDLGLVDEVISLYEQGYLTETTASQAIGYKEVVSYLQGECTLDQARSLIKQASRRYAKRQLSWFRRYEHIRWFDITRINDTKELAQLVIKEVERCTAEGQEGTYIHEKG